MGHPFSDRIRMEDRVVLAEAEKSDRKSTWIRAGAAILAGFAFGYFVMPAPAAEMWEPNNAIAQPLYGCATTKEADRRKAGFDGVDNCLPFQPGFPVKIVKISSRYVWFQAMMDMGDVHTYVTRK